MSHVYWCNGRSQCNGGRVGTLRSKDGLKEAAHSLIDNVHPLTVRGFQAKEGLKEAERGPSSARRRQGLPRSWCRPRCRQAILEALDEPRGAVKALGRHQDLGRAPRGLDDSCQPWEADCEGDRPDTQKTDSSRTLSSLTLSKSPAESDIAAHLDRVGRIRNQLKFSIVPLPAVDVT